MEPRFYSYTRSLHNDLNKTLSKVIKTYETDEEFLNDIGLIEVSVEEVVKSISSTNIQSSAAFYINFPDNNQNRAPKSFNRRGYPRNCGFY